jgi:hypothetical protein
MTRGFLQLESTIENLMNSIFLQPTVCSRVTTITFTSKNWVLLGFIPCNQQLLIVDLSCKKPFVIGNSIFSIFFNQIKAQRDQKICH